MPANASNKSPIAVTPPNLEGKARVDLVKSDFDAVIEQKGYRVYHDKVMRCPCRTIQRKDALSSCRNCGGTGYVYINRFSTKMVLQAMNLDTKFKEWSSEKLGVVKITAREEESISFMDRITLRDAESVASEILFPQNENEREGTPRLFAKTIYPILSVDDIFLFEKENTALIRLEQGVDYTIDEGSNVIVFNNSYLVRQNLTVSIRYKHNPAFYIIDMVRDVMVTTVAGINGRDEEVQMPVHAVGRRTHYVLDEQNLEGTYLIDNSYEISCLRGNRCPLAPKNLKFEITSPTTVSLSWDDVSDAEVNYVVERAGVDLIFSQVALLDPNVTVYDDTGLITNEIYFYRVATRESECQSIWSCPVGVAILIVDVSCADASITVNTTPYATAPSGTPINVDVEDTTGTDVGSLVGGKWQIANATVENSNSTVSVSVEAEGSDVFPDTPIKANGDLVINQPSGVEKDVVVRYETQGVVPTTIVSGEVVVPDAPTFDNSEVWFNGLKVAELASGETWFQIVKVNGELPDSVEWDSPNANFNLIKAGGGATLTIEVYLDAGLTIPYVDGVDSQDDIWIRLNTDLDTPTEYRFLIFDNGLDGTHVVQAGDTLQWNVGAVADVLIYAEAINGIVAACALTAFEVVVIGDPDANDFIAAHNALSGLTMGLSQRAVVTEAYRMAKGTGTPNNNDLLTYFRLNSASRAFPLIPVNDSTVSIAGYTLDMIHLAVGTYNGFAPTDFSVYGVTGGTGKYFNCGIAPNAFPIDAICVGAYSRTNVSTVSIDAGTSNVELNIKEGPYMYVQLNSGEQGIINPDSLGRHAINRYTSLINTITVYKNSSTLGILSSTPSAATSDPTCFHSGRFGYRPSLRQLCEYEQLPGMTASQLEDWAFIIKYIQENVITGGRHVV